MKLIKVIIKPFKLEEVKNILVKIGVTGFTIIETRGYVKENRGYETFSRFNDEINFHPQIMIEIPAPEKLVTMIINRLFEVAKTGKNGDRILVLPLEQAIDVFTEDFGDNIL